MKGLPGLEIDALAHINNLAWLLSRRDTRPRARAAAIKYVDLFLGYVLRAELRNGWWERERRIRTPYADHLDAPGSKAIKHPIAWAQRQDRANSGETWLARTYFARSSYIFVERKPYWLSGVAIVIADSRLSALQNWTTTHARRRLEEETGYRQLWTPEECLDASRVYPRRSVAARFCLALADLCPTPERRRVA